MKADITLVVDRSGSMESIRQDTLGGINSFIRQQRDLEGEAVLTLVFFDNNYQVLCEARPIKDVAPLTNEDYNPNGGTALIDSIWKAMDMAEARVKPEDIIRPIDVGQPNAPTIGNTALIFGIITDGEENASRLHKRSELFERISKAREAGSVFYFLASNQDAIQEAKSMGMGGGQSLNFVSKGGQQVNSISASAAYGAMSSKVGFTRSAGKADSFTAEEQEAAYAGLDESVAKGGTVKKK